MPEMVLYGKGISTTLTVYGTEENTVKFSLKSRPLGQNSNPGSLRTRSRVRWTLFLKVYGCYSGSRHGLLGGNAV
jgi:hypothetical protein